MRHALRQAVMFSVITMVIFGGLYHVGVWGLTSMVMPFRAEGSLVRGADGGVIGSTLIAQGFGSASYLHPRPSAVDYNAASTGGSNLGPSNPSHHEDVAGLIQTFKALNGDIVAPPVEMVTTSGGGLDPHVPPMAASAQAGRIASARGVPVDRVNDIIAGHVEAPALGVFGRSRVNVLAVNLALDEAFGPPPSTAAAHATAR
jgi:K+-transporting ATPase ATPase C chain